MQQDKIVCRHAKCNLNLSHLQPLPVRAAVDILTALAEPSSHALQLFVSCFEIYGGKVYDLLNARKRLEVREDARKKVCIVGLTDFRVSDVSQTPAPRQISYIRHIPELHFSSMISVGTLHLAFKLPWSPPGCWQLSCSELSTT